MIEVDKDKLTIPIYLNQKVVFDMLATIFDGFSEVKTIQSSNSKVKENSSEGELGTGNFFALCSIALKGAKKNAMNEETTINSEKTHTPVSLFQMLKSCLEDNSLVKDFPSDELMEGDFVEIQGIIQQNPLITALENFQRLFTLMNGFEEPKKKNNTGNKALMENAKISAGIKSILEELTSDGNWIGYN